MYYLSIQGGRARAFYLQDENRRLLYRKLRGVLDRRFLLINSPFKTDLLYEASENHNLYLLEKFYEHKDRTFKKEYLSNFFRADTIQDSLESFFNRILHMSVNESWQQQYLEELSRVVKDNPNNPVLRKVIDCYSYFDTDRYTIHIPTEKGKPSLKVTPDNAKMLVMRLLSSGDTN